MQETELIKQIALIALYLALIALVIYLIIAIRRIAAAVGNMNQSVNNINSKIDHLSAKTEPLIDNSIQISLDLKDITANLKTQSQKINGIVDTVKDTTDSIIDFEQKVQKEVETNIFDVLNMVSAVSKGIKSFLNVFSGSSNGYSPKKLKLRDLDDDLQ